MIDTANFVALDFETANDTMGSICQIGIVQFEHGIPVRSFDTLVNPEVKFGHYNMKIHKITAKKVADAPTFPQVHDQMIDLLAGRLVVTHSKFDRKALLQTERRYGLAEIACQWLDTTVVIRHTWDDLRGGGYGLEAMTKRLGINFTHHDAAQDARATGLILVEAIRASERSLEDWLKKFNGRRSIP